MVSGRSSRYWYWYTLGIVRKYTRSLFIGILLGAGFLTGSWFVWPIIVQRLITPVTYIGIVGEVTPSTLPLAIQNEISMGLTFVSPDDIPKPAASVKWEVDESGKRYKFFLPTNIRWHDGSVFKASDVNYNIKNVTFTSTDPDVLEVKLTNPYSPFPVLVSRPLLKPGLIGIGPYKVVAIKLQGDHIELLRLAKVDKVEAKEYRFYKTEAQAITAYKLGEVDELRDLSDASELANWQNTVITKKVNMNRIVSLFFRMSHEVLKEKTVRQALSYAIFQGELERPLSPLRKTSFAFTDKVKRYDFDASQSAKLLNTVGVASQSGTIVINTFPQYVAVANLVADSWSKVGLSTEVKVANTTPDQFDVLLAAFDIPPDPDQYPLWHSTQINTRTNITGYANVRIDKLLEDGREKRDAEDRKKIYMEFQRRLMDDPPVAFVYYPVTYMVKRGK